MYFTSLKIANFTSKSNIHSFQSYLLYSYIDPIHEKDDVPGAIDLWNALSRDTEMGNKDTMWKVWKITQVSSLGIAGTESTSKGLVYGAGSSTGKVPNLKIPNLTWVPAPEESNDLFEEARERIMERSEIDRWYDGVIMGLATFAFAAMYTIVRYHVNVNGSEPTAQIPMYLLDKAFAWTGLWMMVVSPFAGNILAISSLMGRFGSLGFMDKMVTLFSIVIMIIPTVLFSPCYVLWIVMRNMYFMLRGGVTPLYLGQHSAKDKGSFYLKSSLVDMVTLKSESGCVGFAYALIHSFIGLVVCDVSYKSYWFDKVTGRLVWNMELCMTTGCISTVILWAVTMRSLFGAASWIRLKPLYSYASPIGMWFAVVHVMAYGAKGWYKLFNTDYHNGQMSITFVSSMFPACVLMVHHLFGVFGTNKNISDITLWRHSLTNIATQDFITLCQKAKNKAGQRGMSSELYAAKATVANSTNNVNLTSPELFDLIESNVQHRTKHLQQELDQIQKQLKSNAGARTELTGGRNKSKTRANDKQKKKKKKKEPPMHTAKAA